MPLEPGRHERPTAALAVALADSAAGTCALGEALARAVEPGDVLLLDGAFGAGKTTLVQGLARGLGIPEPVTSPSFVLEAQYRGGRLPLYHIDLYRLERLDDALCDELEELLLGDGVAAVEWPSLLPQHLKAGATWLRFEPTNEGRQIILESPHARLSRAFQAATIR